MSNIAKPAAGDGGSRQCIGSGQNLTDSTECRNIAQQATLLSLDSIVIGERHRKYMGDIAGLAANIAELTAFEAASQYAGRGWSVLPCRDKVPLVRNGVHAATRDPATIERWWHTWPQANVAIACGAPSGIVVVDIDAPSQVPELLDLQTLTARTPSGGRHLYFRYVEGIRNRVFDWGEVVRPGFT
jgi:hypothetical protein